MNAFVIRDGWGFDHLAFDSRPEPTAGPGEVLVRVRAAALNYRDLLVAKGQYDPRMPRPRVLGSDAAGEVVAVGPGVTRWTVGDRVASCFFQAWTGGPLTDAAAKSALGGGRDGVLAERVALSEDGVVAVPPHLSDEDAATLPCAAVTAWNALHDPPIRPGETVLVQGTGGVSVFALQFAVALGAKVFVTSGSDDKLARAVGMGAAAGVNYRTTPDWDKWVRAETNGAGVDRVVEVGGAGTLERSVKAVRYGGHVALIGVLAGAGAFNPMGVLMRAVTVRGIYVGSRELFEGLNSFLTRTEIKPVVDRVFPFAEAADAMRYQESGSHFGKVVVRVG